MMWRRDTTESLFEDRTAIVLERRLVESDRSEASKKGWETRRAHGEGAAKAVGAKYEGGYHEHSNVDWAPPRDFHHLSHEQPHQAATDLVGHLTNNGYTKVSGPKKLGSSAVSVRGTKDGIRSHFITKKTGDWKANEHGPYTGD